MLYDRKIFHAFLNDDADELFKYYRNWNDGSGLVSLSRCKPHRCPTQSCTCKAEWVLIKPSSNRQGMVVASNTTLRSRSVVGIRTSWRHVQQPLGSAGDTIGSPGMLKIVSTPKETPARLRHWRPARLRRAA